MRAVISTGASQRVVLNFESCLVKFLLLASPWGFFPSVIPCLSFPLVYLPFPSVTFLITYRPLHFFP